ncbi:uncharacterized protein UHOD_11125 [Ustilago sp. UG-2017b]|nr:uncharacterized protein UHOD_11125 [Ustilago sp. UG-2017b]
MTDQDLNSKLDRLLALMEAQLELSRQSQREERLRQAHLGGEETIEPSHSDDQDQAGGGDESMLGDPNTPTPAPRPRRSVSFNLNEHVSGVSRLKPRSRWLGTISIDTTVMMTPRSGVSVDDDEIDSVGGKVGGVDTSVQCVDYRLR